MYVRIKVHMYMRAQKNWKKILQVVTVFISGEKGAMDGEEED